VRLADVLREVLALYTRKLRFKKIAVKERYAQATEVLGFPGELRQIFANLVANAIEAMPENGCLTVKVGPAVEHANGSRPGVRVSLMDNGPGIERSQMAKVFEPFYTTKKDVGTGLGLWLVHSLVEKHKGWVRVKSRTQPGRTVFSVFLPVQAAAEAESLAADNREREAHI